MLYISNEMQSDDRVNTKEYCEVFGSRLNACHEFGNEGDYCIRPLMVSSDFHRLISYALNRLSKQIVFYKPISVLFLSVFCSFSLCSPEKTGAMCWIYVKILQPFGCVTAEKTAVTQRNNLFNANITMLQYDYICVLCAYNDN